MNTVSFEGYNQLNATFYKAEGLTVNEGDFISLTSAGYAAAAASGADIIGICTQVNGNYVTVQTQGYMEGHIASGESLSCGYVSLTVDANQKITASSTTRKVLVVKVDSAAGIVGFIL